MTPGAYIALARDIGIVLALAFIVWKIYGAGENAVKVDDLKALQTQIAEQGKTLDGWRQESTHANDQLSWDLAALRNPPAAPKPPVWLCDEPAKSTGQVLPSAAPAAGPQLPTTGGAVQGSRRDIRPQLEALKLKYEEQFALCRAEHAQWPK